MTPEQEIEWTQGRARCSTRKPASPPPTKGRRTWRQLQTMKRATEAGANIIDVWLTPSSPTWTRSSRRFPVAGWGKYNKRFKIGGVKITIDGSPQGRTAALHHAVPDRRPRRREELDAAS